MNRFLLLLGSLVLALAACVPAATETPTAVRYAGSPEAARTYLQTAMEGLEANGYGPYRVSAQADGSLVATWTSGANVTYRVLGVVRSVGEGVVEVDIRGSTTNPEQSAYTAVLHLYGELDERLARLE